MTLTDQVSDTLYSCRDTVGWTVHKPNNNKFLTAKFYSFAIYSVFTKAIEVKVLMLEQVDKWMNGQVADMRR
jgi:hypothetical protein